MSPSVVRGSRLWRWQAWLRFPAALSGQEPGRPDDPRIEVRTAAPSG